MDKKEVIQKGKIETINHLVGSIGDARHQLDYMKKQIEDVNDRLDKFEELLGDYKSYLED